MSTDLWRALIGLQINANDGGDFGREFYAAMV